MFKDQNAMEPEVVENIIEIFKIKEEMMNFFIWMTKFKGVPYDFFFQKNSKLKKVSVEWDT